MSLLSIIRKAKDERRKFVSALDTRSFDFILSTWFGSGLIVPAPGTWGTIGGLIFGMPLLYLTNAPFTIIVACILFWAGLRSVERIEKKLHDHDPSFIVIDEVVAILLVLAFLPTSDFLLTSLAGFALFRFFDAKKPWLVGLADQKIHGALGVMMDDIVAAAFAIICFYVLYIPFLFIGSL